MTDFFRCGWGRFAMMTLFLIVVVASFSFPVQSLLTDDLRSYHTFDDADTVGGQSIDKTANNFDGNITGATTSASGFLNEAYSYDGTNDYITLERSMNVFNGLTINCWIDNVDLTADRAISYQYASGNYNHIFRTQNDRKADFIIRDAGGSKTASSTSDAGSGMVTGVFDTAGNDVLIYINGTLEGNTSAVSARLTADGTVFKIGEDSAGTSDFKGTIDECGYWNRTITGEEITQLWNSGVPLAYPFSEPSDNGSLDIFTSHLSDGSIKNSSFISGDDVYTFFNYTNSSGIAITNESAYCEAEFEKPVVEDSSSNDNFTVCSSPVCDYNSIYSEQFNDTTTTNRLRVDVQTVLCYPQTTGDVNVYVNITCDSDSVEHTISPSQIPLCNVGRLEHLEVGTCGNESNFTIHIKSNDCLTDRVQVEDLTADTVYTTFTHNMTYDPTKLWWYYPVHAHEWYVPNTYDINGTCISDDGLRNASDSHQIMINADAPQIFFDSMNNSCGSYNLTDGMSIEYCDNQYTWVSAVVPSIGAEISTLNVTWMDNESNIIRTYYGGNVTSLVTEDEDFLDWIDPYGYGSYILYVWANQTTGNLYAQENLSFFVNDTVAPTVTIISPSNRTNVYDSSTISASCQVTDEALWSMNLTVRNITDGTVFYSYEKTGISDTLWYHQNTSIDISGVEQSLNSTDWTLETICIGKDAHTGEELKILRHPSIDGTTFSFTDPIVGFLEVTVKGAFVNPSFVMERDRYVFTFDSMIPKDEIEYTIKADSIECYDDVYGYKGHCMINKRFWWDSHEANADVLYTDISYFSVDPDLSEAEITVYLDEYLSSFRTESLGELNVWNSSVYQSNYDSSSETIQVSGIRCGERYPNNVNTLNLNETDELYNCTVRVNEAFITYMSGRCTETNLTTNIGWNVVEINGISALGVNITQECSIFTDKYEKSVGDFAWFIILACIILFFLMLSTKAFIFMTMAGMMTIALGFMLWIHSYWLSLFVMFAGLFLIITSMFSR